MANTKPVVEMHWELLGDELEPKYVNALSGNLSASGLANSAVSSIPSCEDGGKDSGSLKPCCQVFNFVLTYHLYRR